MPLYRVLSRADALTDESRAAYAGDVTRVHCEVTGAPPEFVHVVYREDSEGELDDGRSAFVFGSIRAGRTDGQKEDLVEGLRSALAGRSGLTPDAIDVLTVDVPASWVMEGGRVLPEPGDEDDWMAAGS